MSSSATRNRSRFGGDTRDNAVNLLRLWSPGLDRVLAHAAVDGQPVSLRIGDGRWHVLVQRAGALRVETVTPRDSDLASLLGELRALRAEGLPEFTPEERARYRVDPLTPQAQPDRQEQAAPPRPANRAVPRRSDAASFLDPGPRGTLIDRTGNSRPVPRKRRRGYPVMETIPILVSLLSNQWSGSANPHVPYNTFFQNFPIQLNIFTVKFYLCLDTR